MLGWWKKNKVPRSSIPEESHSLLTVDLRRLDSVAKGLGDRALRYALEGSDADVVAALAATTGGGRALQLKCVGAPAFGSGGERESFFRRLPEQAPSFYLRLALLYEAASRREPRKLLLDWVPGSPPWLEIFLWEASDLRPNTWKGDNAAFVGFELTEGMLKLGDASPEVALRAIFFADPRNWGTRHIVDLMGAMKGLADAAGRHPGVVSAALGQVDAKCRVHALELLRRHGVDPRPHVLQLVGLALVPAKTVRSSAQALLRRVPDVVETLARQKAVDGNPEERAYAAALLFSLQAEGVRPFLEERLAAEPSPRVRKVVEDLLRGGPSPDVAGEATTPPDLTLPPLPIAATPALSGSVREALERLARDWERKALATTQRQRATNPKCKVPDPPAVTKQALDLVFAQMQAQTLAPGALRMAWAPSRDWRWRLDEADANRFLEHPELDLVHVVRFLAATGLIDSWDRGFRQGVMVDRHLRHFRRSRHLEFGLREVGAALAASGIDPELIGWTRLDSWSWQGGFDWEAEGVWPYFADRLEILEEALDLRPSRDEKDVPWLRGKRKTNALAVLETFPRMPSTLQPKLWEIALGSAKTDRIAAQRCLAKVPGSVARVMEALRDGTQDVRCLAAEWLAEIRHTEAIPAIEAALRKEKQDAARAAFMDALEALGAPVDHFLNRPGLAEEAQKGLRKGVPVALSWFAFDRLPAVRWADMGENIPRDVLTWLVVQAHKLGSPEAGALLRRYAHEMHSADREELGRFVLEAWIAQDIQLPTSQEVQAKAQQMAQQMLSYYKGKTLQELADEMAQSLRNQPKGSAVGDKGVLAIAGACAGPAPASLAQQYFKTWYGYRAAQCRALLQMLSWVEHPTAIQLVLSTATRFRTAGIREEAEKQAQLIAERKGWSLAELADRTIPTAGFDERGELELNCGVRRFVARIAQDLSVTLANAEGKSISALPEARGEDSAELVAAAKKSLSNAKKELKTALKLQRERLYEAMCTQRAWSFEDWDTYLHRHPILGRYCRQLVWLASVGEERVVTFRPLGDGSMTSARDEPVTFPPAATVRIGHACNTPEDDARAWIEQLAAYELEPLFDQFGRAVCRLSRESLQRARIDDYQGHLLQAFKLRARATKLGYVRGASEDGGWFFAYRKHFTTLGFDAVVEFSGNSLPEENRTVALRSLYFTRGKDGSSPYGPENECALGEIPAVLLSECWNDVRTIAAEGTGFDPDWEKKVES